MSESAPARDPATRRALRHILAPLELEPIEENLFRGHNAPDRHVFGGQVLAQAILAAYATVEERPLHSLHAYFLLAGDSGHPILFEVDRIRDGRSFTTRRVVGIQHGEAIFSLSASFQRSEEGFEHQAEMPEVPPPEELTKDEDHFRRLAAHEPALRRFAARFQAIDSRQVEGIYMLPREGREPRPAAKSTWMRINGELPDRPEIHRAVLAYLSDMDFMSVAMLPHGPAFANHTFRGASLDHALWFHRPFRADRWLLFAKEGPAAAGARGFVRGSFFDREGRLVASVAQECLMRLRPKDPDHPVDGERSD